MARKKKSKDTSNFVIKIRIYPNKRQIGFMENQFKCCETLYNKGIAYNKECYITEEQFKIDLIMTDSYAYNAYLKILKNYNESLLKKTKEPITEIKEAKAVSVSRAYYNNPVNCGIYNPDTKSFENEGISFSKYSEQYYACKDHTPRYNPNLDLTYSKIKEHIKKKSISLKDLMTEEDYKAYKEMVPPFRLSDMYEEMPYLKEQDSIALNNAINDVDTAFNNFFSGRTGYPRFKKKGEKKSFTSNRGSLYLNKPNNIGNVSLDVEKKCIKLPKLKEPIKAVVHRLPEENWVLKSITVSKEAGDEYYASCLFEFSKTYSKPCKTKHADEAVGLDYSQKSLYVDSNGNDANMPRYFQEAETKLAKYMRQLSKKQIKRVWNEETKRYDVIKSKKYMELELKIKKLEAHIARQRKHFQEQEICKLSEYGIVAIENLDMKEQSNKENRPVINEKTGKKHESGKKTNENAWGNFTVKLQAKVESKGNTFVKINKWEPSSQKCNCCGYINKITKDTRVRQVKCPNCGSEYDRDENAAKNIRDAGVKIVENAISTSVSA